MTLYAESSAVLAWLLEQQDGETVAATLAQAELVIASDVTLIECDRVITRAIAVGEIEEQDAVQRQARLNAVSARWTLLALEEEIIERARRTFPIEPVRTLDAIHIASALVAREAIGEIAVLSLDHRVRQAADRLGFPVSPSDAELRLRAGIQDIEPST